MKLYLDPGHGGSDPGAQGNGLTEKEINLDIALRIRTLLTNRYENIQVRMSRTDDRYKSLTDRTNEANNWGANYYLSIHCNAYNDSASGYEDYIHDSLSDSSVTAHYQNILHEEITKVNQLRDRGKKKANFHVLRETRMPAFLSENGFIDNNQDSKLLMNPAWRQDVAQGHVHGLEKAFNLQRKSEDPTMLYKVIAGSFQFRKNAERRVTYLHKRDIESFVTTITKSGETWYRVQAGAFSTRENAEKRLNEVKSLRISDAYIMIDNQTEQEESKGYTIKGPTFLSAHLMDQFVKSINAQALELGIYYLAYGEMYGIRGDIAFAQAMHETDYLRFTGIVNREQNNFGGLGATGEDNPGVSFDTPEDGVLAHIQHLYAYASTETLPNDYPLIDPRFYLVTRGSASTWTELNGKWAVPGDTYGQSILDLYKKMVNYSVEKLNEVRQSINN